MGKKIQIPGSKGSAEKKNEQWGELDVNPPQGWRRKERKDSHHHALTFHLYSKAYVHRYARPDRTMAVESLRASSHRPSNG